jgi:thiol-disulfide isomerase/thioredoxin
MTNKKIKFMRLILLITVALSACSAQSSSKYSEASSSINTDSLSIIINGKPTLLYRWDEFGGSFPLTVNFVSNKNEYFYNAHFKNKSVFIVPKEAQKVIFYYTPNTGFWNCKHDDKSIEAALNFDVIFRETKKPIFGINESIKYQFFNIVYYNNPTLRNNDIESYFREKLSFLESYANEKNIPKLYITIWKQQIALEKIGAYLNLGEEKSIEKYSKEYLKYILDIAKQKEKYREEYENPIFKLNLLNELKILKIAENVKGIDLTIELIKKKFDAQDSEFLMYYFIDKNFADIPVKKIQTLIEEFKKLSPNNVYFKILEDRLNSGSHKKFDVELVDFQNQNNSFKSVLDNKKQYTYIDFWASWCGPCRVEMPDSKKLKEIYESKGVQFVYISTDDNNFPWIKAEKELGISEYTNYRLVNRSNLPVFLKNIDLSSIPRYIILDKEGKIINTDAPRPSDPKIWEIFDKLLKK